MLSLAIALLLHAGTPVERPVGGHSRRIWGTCHGAGTMCDTGHCCKGLVCVEETAGKMCRKAEPQENTPEKKREK